MLPGDVGFVEDTLKASLSKSMWDTRVTTGACSERDRGQFFLWMLKWLDAARLIGRAK